MLIPLGTDVRLKRPTLVTYVLMAVCVIAFMGQKIADGRTSPAESPVYNKLMLFGFESDGERFNTEFLEQMAGERELVNFTVSRWYQYVTYQFLHADWLHLLGNMLFLFVFGPPVEDRFRRFGFLGFYLLGGILAGLAHGLLEVKTHSYAGYSYRAVTPVLGASGSIAAVSGAYLVLFPLAPVRLLSFFGLFSLSGWIFVCLSVAFDLIFLATGDHGIAHFAHLGGYLGGAGVAMLLLWRRIIPRETYDLFSIARQAHRRRAYRALVSKGPAHSPFVKDASEYQRVPTKGKASDDPHGPARREINALSSTSPAEATDRYLELLREDAACVLSRDAQLVVANQLYQRGDHQNAVDAYERFLKRYPGDREEDQTHLLIAMICARQLNDPMCATKHLDAIELSSLPESLRDLATTIREELS